MCREIMGSHSSDELIVYVTARVSVLCCSTCVPEVCIRQALYQKHMARPLSVLLDLLSSVLRTTKVEVALLKTAWLKRRRLFGNLIGPV